MASEGEDGVLSVLRPNCGFRALLTVAVSSTFLCVSANAQMISALPGFSSQPLLPPEDAPDSLFPGADTKVRASRASGAVRATLPTAGGGVWFAQGPAPILFGQVESVSPNNEVDGAVHVVLPHPANADILYAGAVNGGVWKTIDGTVASPTWTALTDDLPGLSVGALEFDPTDLTSNTLVAGVGRFSSFGARGGPRAGVYRSTNAGTSWTQLTGGGVLTGKNISGIAARGTVIVAAVNFAPSFSCADFGVFRSTNTGATFSRISGASGSGLPNGISFDLEGHPNEPATLYAAIKFADACGDIGQNGIYKSMDTGATWVRVSNASMNLLITDVATSNIEISVFDDGVDNRVYVAILNSGQLRNGGVFRSPDGGASWTAMDIPLTNEAGGNVGTNPRFKPDSGAPGGQGSIHFSIEADPFSTNLVYVGGDRQPAGAGDCCGFPNAIGALNFTGRLFRGDASAGAGSQWVHLTHSSSLGPIGGGTANVSAPHADSREIAFGPSGVMLESDDGGVYRRTSPQDNTGDWFSINGTLQVTELHDIAYDNVSNLLVGGGQDTGTAAQLVPNQPAWFSMSQGDGGDVAIDETSRVTLGQSVRYTSSQFLGGFRRSLWDSSGVFVSDTFPALATAGASTFFVDDGGQFVTPVVLNEKNPTRLVIGGSSFVYETMDFGATVAPLSPLFTANAMVYGGRAGNVNNPDVLWAAGLDISLLPAVAVRPGSGMTMMLTNWPGNEPEDICVNSENWTEAYVVDGTSIYRTTDMGSSYTDVTGNLAGATVLRSVIFVALPGRDIVLVGTDAGVFYSDTSNLVAWVRLGSNLPNAPVWDMEYEITDDVVAVGTLGRGAWTIADFTMFINANLAQPGINIFVDGAHAGAELGTAVAPFTTVTTANAFVLSSGTLHIVPGTYTEGALTIDRPMTLVREGVSGVVTID